MNVKVRAIVMAALVGLLVLVPAGAALAHEGEEEDLTAKDLVQQAIGILEEQPGMTGEVEDKISEALADDETEGVDLGIVEQAKQALEAGRVSETLDLLARSIGTQVGQPTVGGGLEAPKGTAGPILIAAAAGLIVVGGIVARKVR